MARHGGADTFCASAVRTASKGPVSARATVLDVSCEGDPASPKGVKRADWRLPPAAPAADV
jgi:hypothetical protein